MTDAQIALIADDGCFVTLGRRAAPSEDEIASAAEALRAERVGGWLAEMSGRFYGRHCPALTMLREVARPRATWDEAVAAFRAAHAASVAALPCQGRAPRKAARAA